mmetsp:Transcript_38512/g.36876  ORF Transcript_38512/g.36876 Transcript_38512/m.36876 type:complete len:94 (+) Transcript_38512:1166-1447(+)
MNKVRMNLIWLSIHVPWPRLVAICKAILSLWRRIGVTHDGTVHQPASQVSWVPFILVPISHLLVLILGVDSLLVVEVLGSAPPIVRVVQVLNT